jgi:twitching motility protein PilT
MHAFRGDGGIALSLRLLSGGIPPLESLGLPPVVSTFADLPSGLVLFTGPTGSGKSTALAALVDEINRKHARHIVTVEDPIEYRHASARSLIRQREIGRDVASYAESLRGVLRADPDVILIGELRDPEVMSACLQASETGHLVFSTLHTSEAAETVQRIVGVFEGSRQEQVRMQLAQALQAIVSMRLVPDASGRGRRAACEVLLNSPAVRSQLVSPERALQVRNTIETSRKDGMQTLEMDLSRLVSERLVTYEAALAASDYPEQIRVAAGIR